MKARLSLVVIGLIASFNIVLGQNETKLSDELFITKLSDTIYIATHYFPWGSNSLIVRASDQDVVLVDTPYDTSATALLVEWIEQVFNPVTITAVNTGFHVDNLGGNDYLRMKGFHIYGSDLTVKLIDERGTQTQQKIISWLRPDQDHIKKVYESMTFVKPNKVFTIDEGILLEIGNLTFDVFYPGESHSPDNVVVYIEEASLLFGGCMVKSLSSPNLGFTGDANLIEWPKSMRIIEERYANTKTVVPHHGEWGDMRLVEHTLILLSK